MKDLSLKRLKPGETFELEGKTYRVEKEIGDGITLPRCSGCAFEYDDLPCNLAPYCHDERPYGSEGCIFVELKTEKK